MGDIKIRAGLGVLEVFGVSNTLIEMLRKGLHLIKHSQATLVGPHYTSYRLKGESPPRHLLTTSHLTPDLGPETTLIYLTEASCQGS